MRIAPGGYASGYCAAMDPVTSLITTKAGNQQYYYWPPYGVAEPTEIAIATNYTNMIRRVSFKEVLSSTVPTCFEPDRIYYARRSAAYTWTITPFGIRIYNTLADALAQTNHITFTSQQVKLNWEIIFVDKVYGGLECAEYGASNIEDIFCCPPPVPLNTSNLPNAFDLEWKVNLIVGNTEINTLDPNYNPLDYYVEETFNFTITRAAPLKDNDKFKDWELRMLAVQTAGHGFSGHPVIKKLWYYNSVPPISPTDPPIFNVYFYWLFYLDAFSTPMKLTVEWYDMSSSLTNGQWIELLGSLQHYGKTIYYQQGSKFVLDSIDLSNGIFNNLQFFNNGEIPQEVPFSVSGYTNLPSQARLFMPDAFMPDPNHPIHLGTINEILTLDPQTQTYYSEIKDYMNIPGRIHIKVNFYPTSASGITNIMNADYFLSNGGNFPNLNHENTLKYNLADLYFKAYPMMRLWVGNANYGGIGSQGSIWFDSRIFENFSKATYYKPSSFIVAYSTWNNARYRGYGSLGNSDQIPPPSFYKTNFYALKSYHGGCYFSSLEV